MAQRRPRSCSSTPRQPTPLTSCWRTQTASLLLPSRPTCHRSTAKPLSSRLCNMGRTSSSPMPTPASALPSPAMTPSSTRRSSPLPPPPGTKHDTWPRPHHFTASTRWSILRHATTQQQQLLLGRVTRMTPPSLRRVDGCTQVHSATADRRPCQRRVPRHAPGRESKPRTVSRVDGRCHHRESVQHSGRRWCAERRNGSIGKAAGRTAIRRRPIRSHDGYELTQPTMPAWLSPHVAQAVHITQGRRRRLGGRDATGAE